ncbi:translation initiation factor IF-3 [Wolbachia endosymbiont of Howardula sp.]|uniref:translation initiation factor IF-3 n=1 Tax=Wolbachia endosymbiont of Howardula sp. TaxID=2916816 RepID=UPI00217D5452|nr:translation initiation factor IF-3 [Wolbachia endosymbiont of Howardula sp.]UWI83293.1 translation initiation factor IF-3 [Wolbachia endosymbiont of Howardula sp.]
MQVKKNHQNRVNAFITAKEVRLVHFNGEMIGIVSIEEALEYAQNAGLDLVEIVPDSIPPVCKVLDYSKQKYYAKKKASEARKKQKALTTKEIKIGPNISDHDYLTKLRQIKLFLVHGHKVKVTMKFRGRELIYTDMGLNKLHRLVKDIEEIAKVELAPKKEGNQYYLILAVK